MQRGGTRLGHGRYRRSSPLIWRVALGLALWATGSASARQQTMEWSSESDDVRISASLAPARPSLADEVLLEIEVDAPWRLTVAPPDIGESLGPFGVLSWRADPPQRQGDRLLSKYHLRLEPLDIGELEVPPLVFRGTVAIEAGDDGRTETRSRYELPGQVVVVGSSLDPKNANPANLKPLAGPLPPAPPAESRDWTWWLVGGALLATAAAFVWFRTRPKTTPQETPAEIARRRLQLLRADGLEPSNGKRLLKGLTDAVRWFIEQTTALQAAEQTTEEFLTAATQQGVFAPAERSKLQRLLEQADLVKFAGVQATREDLQEMFRFADAFVDSFREAGDSTAGSPEDTP